jgi:hypothetical protein
MREKRRCLPKRPLFEADTAVAGASPVHADPEIHAFVDTLRRDGAAVIDLGAPGRRLCDQAVVETEDVFAAGASRVQDAWRTSPAVRRLATLPMVREFLAAAFGRDPIPFQTLNFREGSQQAVHADTVHFHSVPERFMCGVWIALEDVEPGSGPLLYYPGSHRLPVMTMQDAGVNRSRPTPQDYDRHFVPRFAQRIAASGLPQAHAILRTGEALVWAANLAHGGAPIERPGSTRRSLVVHNYFEACVYYTPMTSDPQSGRLNTRLPPNIRTGGWAWPQADGRPVWPGSKAVLHAALTRALGRPHVFRA